MSAPPMRWGGRRPTSQRLRKGSPTLKKERKAYPACSRRNHSATLHRAAGYELGSAAQRNSNEADRTSGHWLVDSCGDKASMKTPLLEGTDYYVEDGKYVFTEAYHLKRGTCCNSGCRHCPYEPKGGSKGALSPRKPDE
jgi:hypothetical protein